MERGSRSRGSTAANHHRIRWGGTAIRWNDQAELAIRCGAKWGRTHYLEPISL
ncbi:hypothetical protein [Paenibacillus sp. LjRoot56]|uniref:hypothetical protein n=1 Tax=Paenibacillus sp. LjRoot56 TaxID=3342333 RepID=UPI003ED16209